MGAYELADELSKFMTEDEYTELDKTIFKAVTMIRHQADYIAQLEKGLESSIAMNKAQAERQVKELTDEEIESVYYKDFNFEDADMIEFARAILRKAQEK
jgi:hypothetical protein